MAAGWKRRVVRAPFVAYADGTDSAVVDPSHIGELTGLSDARVLLGWTITEPSWVGRVEGVTVMVGAGTRAAVAAGRLRYLPVRLSAIPRLLADQLRPTVAVVAGVRRGDGLAYRGTVGWGPAACRVAEAVVVEVDDDAPDLGAPLIEGPIVGTVDRPPIDRPDAPRDTDEADAAIGDLVAELLPVDATVQLGPGGIAEAIVAALHRPVRIHSGLITDAMASLAPRGLLDGVATAGYVWGGAPIAELAESRRLALVPVEETHDVGRIAAIDRFVGCNTALQLGLDGSVNVERVRGRTVAGIGGHADFCAGAAASSGGLSIIALRSTTPRGHSTIVPAVEVVTTPRSDVDVVVTEHGVADLRGLDDSERARAITAVAAPEHRAGLRV